MTFGNFQRCCLYTYEVQHKTMNPTTTDSEVLKSRLDLNFHVSNKYLHDKCLIADPGLTILYTGQMCEMTNTPTNNKMGSEFEGHINHLSLLHQPLSLSSVQSISFLQKPLLKGVLINLDKEDTRFIKAICQGNTLTLCQFYPSM